MNKDVGHIYTYVYSLLCLWDFPGRNTGVGCHFLLHARTHTHTHTHTHNTHTHTHANTMECYSGIKKR